VVFNLVKPETEEAEVPSGSGRTPAGAGFSAAAIANRLLLGRESPALRHKADLSIDNAIRYLSIRKFPVKVTVRLVHDERFDPLSPARGHYCKAIVAPLGT
jgi:hypothetical protein